MPTNQAANSKTEYGTDWNIDHWKVLHLLLTPFNFTAIAANLPSKYGDDGKCGCLETSLSHKSIRLQVIMDLFKEAGLPDGVININIHRWANNRRHRISIILILLVCILQVLALVFSDHMWNTLSEAILHKYKTYPRIVGETGGKDFVLVHKSADVDTTVSSFSSEVLLNTKVKNVLRRARAYIPG
jgi:1-pyrroline-5-carboxylate dehydrogenase